MRKTYLAVLSLMILVGCSKAGGEETSEPTEQVETPIVETTAEATQEATPTTAAVVGAPAPSGAFEQSQIMAQHSQLSADAAAGGDLGGAKRHAEHVVNIIVGQNSGDQFGIAFGDHNGDGAAENPGDGFGVWPYTNDAINQIDTLIESPDTPAETGTHLNEARQCLVNLREKAQTTLEHARAVLTAADVTIATTAGQIMATAANEGAVGVDVDANGTIDLIQGECGAQQVQEILTQFAPELLQAGE